MSSKQSLSGGSYLDVDEAIRACASHVRGDDSDLVVVVPTGHGEEVNLRARCNPVVQEERAVETAASAGLGTLDLDLIEPPC